MFWLYWRHDRSGAAALQRYRACRPRVRELRLFRRDGLKRRASSSLTVRHGFESPRLSWASPQRIATSTASRRQSNTHVSHAFYLNCRKLADLFQNKLGRDKDDIMAEHYVSKFYATLPVSTNWRVPMKQLAHVTYARHTSAREIDRSACEALYK